MLTSGKNGEQEAAALQAALRKVQIPCQVCLAQSEDETGVKAALQPYAASVQPVVVAAVSAQGVPTALAESAMKTCRHPVLTCDLSLTNGAFCGLHSTVDMAARILAPSCPKIAAALLQQ